MIYLRPTNFPLHLSFRCSHRLEKELARLEKNRQSRHQRENQRTKKVQQTVVQSSWSGASILAANPHDGQQEDLNSGGQQYVSSDHPSSSSAAPAPSVIMAAPKVGDNQNRRRCTACGQPGHYRSNKKYKITPPSLSFSPFFSVEGFFC